MKNNQVRILISHSIIWAALMIAVAALTSDATKGQTVLFIMIAAWFSSQSLLQNALGSKWSANPEVACLKKWVGLDSRQQDQTSASSDETDKSENEK